MGEAEGPVPALQGGWRLHRQLNAARLGARQVRFVDRRTEGRDRQQGRRLRICENPSGVRASSPRERGDTRCAGKGAPRRQFGRLRRGFAAGAVWLYDPSGRRETYHMKRLLLAAGAALALGAVGTAPAIAQGKSIKIGFVSTFSGPTAVIGNDMRNSFELALDHLGRKMGGLPVEVIYEDDQQKPEVGRQKSEKLVQSDKVDFVVGY